jgi:hypothetical protein
MAWQLTVAKTFPITEHTPEQFIAGLAWALPPKIEAADTLIVLDAPPNRAPVVPVVSAPPVIVPAVTFNIPAAVTLMQRLAFALVPLLCIVVQLTVSVPVPECRMQSVFAAVDEAIDVATTVAEFVPVSRTVPPVPPVSSDAVQVSVIPLLRTNPPPAVPP